MNESPPDSYGQSHSGPDGNNSPPGFAWLRWPAAWFYLIFSGLDITLTYQLLVTQDHVESNPIARYFIEGWGLKGMVWFKLIMTAFVLVLVHVLLQNSRVRALAVVRLGAVLVGSVVVYSVWLLSQG
ncbi:MAG: DUF5658 family protein [Planctomycetaceae bacterium]